LFPSKRLRFDSAQRDILIFINCFWTPSQNKKESNYISGISYFISKAVLFSPEITNTL